MEANKARLMTLINWQGKHGGTDKLGALQESSLNLYDSLKQSLGGETNWTEGTPGSLVYGMDLVTEEEEEDKQTDNGEGKHWVVTRGQ